MVLTCYGDQQFCDIRVVCVGFYLFLVWQKFIYKLTISIYNFWYKSHIPNKNETNGHIEEFSVVSILLLLDGFRKKKQVLQTIIWNENDKSEMPIPFMTLINTGTANTMYAIYRVKNLTQAILKSSHALENITTIHWNCDGISFNKLNYIFDISLCEVF